MCECCGGDCQLCGGGGWIEFPEPIVKIDVHEIFDENGCTIEQCIINDRWKLISDPGINPPFRIEERMNVEHNLGCTQPGETMESTVAYNSPKMMKIPEIPDIWTILKERGIDPLHALPNVLISRIEDIGRARAILEEVLDSHIFDNLQKHNPFWQPETHREEVKLNELRLKFCYLHEKLCDLAEILQKQE